MIIPPDSSEASSSTHTTYRIKRGTKLADIPHYSSGSNVSLANFDGPFQLSEYLALKVRSDPHDAGGLVDVPKGDSVSGNKAPERDVWIYEHLRRIPIDLTTLLTSLLSICSKETCPEMKADQWLYFCSAHTETSECSAIDYILHTVDVTTATVNSSRQFPSRMSIPQESLKHFPSLFRRLSRIFSHAYYHHREAFSLAESETSLYARFVALCDRYSLVGRDLLVIPHEAINASDLHDDEEEEEDEDEDSDEDEEDEDEGEGESERGDEVRGRGEVSGREKRTRSLDRHGPHDPVQPVLPPKLLQRQETVVPTPSQPALSSPEKSDPFRSSPPDSTSSKALNGKKTLGRGKQPRGTMLWNSDMDAGEVSLGPELSRTGSSQTAILIEEPQQQLTSGSVMPVDGESVGGSGDLSKEMSKESESEETTEDEVPVPKDEIELLEEEGIIPPEPTVSPLPPTGVGETQTDDQRDAPEDDVKDLGKGHLGNTNTSPKKGADESAEIGSEAASEVEAGTESISAEL